MDCDLYCYDENLINGIVNIILIPLNKKVNAQNLKNVFPLDTLCLK